MRLAGRWLHVGTRFTRANPSPTTLMSKLQSEIEELRQMDREQLIAKFEEIWGKPPRVRSREYLWKRIAWKLEEQRNGGLSNLAKAELERLIAQLELPWDENTRRVTGKLRGRRRPNDPAPGTVLVRDYKGQRIQVEVVDDGFVWEDRRYKSLSAVALAVTGSRWNGRLFFGLTERAR